MLAIKRHKCDYCNIRGISRDFDQIENFRQSCEQMAELKERKAFWAHRGCPEIFWQILIKITWIGLMSWYRHVNSVPHRRPSVLKEVSGFLQQLQNHGNFTGFGATPPMHITQSKWQTIVRFKIFSIQGSNAIQFGQFIRFMLGQLVWIKMTFSPFSGAHTTGDMLAYSVICRDNLSERL